jgi:hypothetical protein
MYFFVGRRRALLAEGCGRCSLIRGLRGRKCSQTLDGLTVQQDGACVVHSAIADIDGRSLMAGHEWRIGFLLP